MAKLVFKDPQVAEKYETNYETDPIVHLPGGKEKNGWKGKLSEIPIAQADRWIDHPKQNLLRRKQTPAPSKKQLVEKPPEI